MKKLLELILSVVCPPFGFIAKLFDGLFSWRPPVSTIVAGIIAILATVGFTVQTVRINGIHIAPKIIFFKVDLIDIKGYKEEVAELNKLINQWKDDSKVAKANQIEENTRNSKESKVVAGAINNAYDSSKKQVLDALDQHLRSSNAICLRNDVKDLSKTGQDAGVRETTGPTQGGNTGDLGTDMVAIPRSDYEHFTVNTKDLQTLRLYFKVGIENGWFVPWSDDMDKKPDEPHK